MNNLESFAAKKLDYKLWRDCKHSCFSHLLMISRARNVKLGAK